MAFSVSLTVSATISCEASGSAMRFVKRARVLLGASRVLGFSQNRHAAVLSGEQTPYLSDVVRNADDDDRYSGIVAGEVRP